ncbi:DUF4229 domain-containing protein [Streptomyces sp. NBC_01190]|uniref:DUF4229 domain-containing protein n=1 Tax=Streptomyces sp. NBC_01190 TaxID=2903767 RepID=UPI003863A8F9|nr:DUF4229 domain-containing protein [Streptomyces sp. NBC_01190]
MFRYTALRFGLIVGCFGVIWALVRVRLLPAGLGDSNYLWVALLALVVSAPLSFVLLRGAREEAARKVSARVERTRLNLAASIQQEDEADDAARAAAVTAGPPAATAEPVPTPAPAAPTAPAARDGEPHTA